MTHPASTASAARHDPMDGRLPPASHLLALDWGTSSFRAAVMTADGEILREVSAADGILSVVAGDFESVLQKHCGDWLREWPHTVTLAAGMIGSRQGWHEAPYVACPAGFAEMAAGVVWPQPGRRLGFVPGLQALLPNGAPDVLRGEEVQIFGLIDALGVDDGIFVLPGTHSKWVVVEKRRVQRFRTFMTGELFALARRHSILARTMPAEDSEMAWPAHRPAFEEGCAASREGLLLHSLFSVRARGLFGLLPGEAQPEYLSGLLIGEEIREALSGLGTQVRGAPVHLVCNAALRARYEVALQVFGIDTLAGPDHASFGGLLAIAREHAFIA